MKINVKEFLGGTINIEDGIVLRSHIENNLDKNIELNFTGLDRIPTTFFTCLFTDLINKNGRKAIIDKISVNNLSNYSDYSRVVKGTSFN